MNSFSIDQKKLLNVLSWMQPICTKRTTLDTTGFLLLHLSHKEIIIKATDLEISLQATCPLVSTDLIDNHQFLVNGKRLYEVIKELEGTLTMALQSNQLHIKAFNIDFVVNTKDAESFPAFPERIENTMQISADILQKLFDKVSFLIPQNNANPALNGLYMEVGADGLTLTTTDGHSLAQIKSQHYSHHEEKKWLLPRRAIIEIKKLLDSASGEPIFIGLCNNQLVFSAQYFNFFTKLLAQQFPAYASILHKEGFSQASIEKNSFIKTLRRTACLLSGTFIATEFLFDNNELQVKISNKEIGNFKEALPIEALGDARFDIRFYTPYLLNGLSSFDDNQLTFYLHSAARPIMFQTQNDDYSMSYLVMPVCPTSLSA